MTSGIIIIPDDIVCVYGAYHDSIPKHLFFVTCQSFKYISTYKYCFGSENREFLPNVELYACLSYFNAWESIIVSKHLD